VNDDHLRRNLAADGPNLKWLTHIEPHEALRILAVE
jgi:hypothetical protein